MSIQTEIEEFLRHNPKFSGVNWIDAYYSMVSRDFLREMRDYLNPPWSDTILKFILETYGREFFIEIYGKEKLEEKMKTGFSILDV